MKNIFIIGLLALLFVVNTIQAQDYTNTPTAESIAKEQTADYRLALQLSKEQTAKVYDILLENTQRKLSLRGKEVAEADKAQARQAMKANQKKIQELLDERQKRRFRTMKQTERLQRELDLSNLQREALFDAMINKEEGLRKNRSGQQDESVQSPPSEEEKEAMRKIRKTYVKQLKDILTKDQFKGFKVQEESRRLEYALGLSKEQVQQVEAILNTHSKSQMKVMGKGMATSREATRIERKKMEAQKNEQISALLSAEQKTKFEEMMKRGGGR